MSISTDLGFDGQNKPLILSPPRMTVEQTLNRMWDIDTAIFGKETTPEIIALMSEWHRLCSTLPKHLQDEMYKEN